MVDIWGGGGCENPPFYYVCIQPHSVVLKKLLARGWVDTPFLVPCVPLLRHLWTSRLYRPGSRLYAWLYSGQSAHAVCVLTVVSALSSPPERSDFGNDHGL